MRQLDDAPAGRLPGDRDLAALEAAARDHFRHLAAHPAEVLAQIGSPGCLLEVAHEPLTLAA